MENQLPSTDRSRVHLLLGVTIGFSALGTLVVFARVLVRHFIVKSLGKDDWAMLLGWVAMVFYNAEIATGCRWGFAMPTTAVTPIAGLMKIILSVEMTYYLAVASVKVSIVLFYLRLVEAERTLRYLCIGTIYLLITFLVVCEIATLEQCIPIKKQWDFTDSVPGHCINTTASFYSTSGFNIITDIWIIALPIRLLSKIHRPKSELLILFAVFGMGIFACVASIIRLYSIRIFTFSKDPFYDVGPVNIWSMVEINVAIVCASVPALKPLFTHMRRPFASRPSAPTSPAFSPDSSYGIKSLKSNEGDNTQVTSHVVSHGGQGFVMVQSQKRKVFCKYGSREPIISETGDEEMGGIEMDREFTFDEERVAPTEKHG